jgi:hypothetical protein
MYKKQTYKPVPIITPMFIYSFHSKSISTNAAIVIYLSLRPNQFNGVEMAMMW